MKIKDLFESTEKSLIGMKIDGKTLPVEGEWEGNFNCYNRGLTSLEGAPSSVKSYFVCNDNKLTSLEGAPAEVGGFFTCNDNQIASLKGVHRQIKKIKGNFDVENNPIKSHVLGLLLIDGLIQVIGDRKQKWIPILNSAIQQFDDKRKRVMWAQSELIKQLGEQGKALAQL